MGRREFRTPNAERRKREFRRRRNGETRTKQEARKREITAAGQTAAEIPGRSKGFFATGAAREKTDSEKAAAAPLSSATATATATAVNRKDHDDDDDSNEITQTIKGYVPSVNNSYGHYKLSAMGFTILPEIGTDDGGQH